MVVSLIDTSVLVDILRGHSPALSWLSTQTDLGVSAVVWIELLQGARDKPAQSRALALLKKFERVDLTVIDVDWAIQTLLRYHLSHHVGGIDCLIASVNHRLNVPLYTTNLKHFTPLLKSLAQRPY